MKRPQIKLAQYVIEACKAKQVKHIVISPGSRNAPLTLALPTTLILTVTAS